MRGEVGPLRSGSPFERAEHIGPLLQHIPVDLLEQQPATICSEKGKIRLYPVKTVFTPHAQFSFSVLEGQGIFI